MKSIEEKIKNFVLARVFSEAQKLVPILSKDVLEEFLFVLACEEQNIVVYDFVCFLIKERETADLHCLASKLLNIKFCHIEGAYEQSLGHIGRAIQINPHDLSLQEALFFFNDIPEKLIPDSEAKWLAQGILKKYPESVVAGYFLDNYKND
jgi:hypothetical protein